MSQRKIVEKLLADCDAEVSRIEQNLRAARGRRSEAAAAVDEYNLSLKPVYPTNPQRDGIAEAARRIHADIKPKSHHGDSCNTPEYPAAVVVDGARGWLNVRHAAPYSLRQTGSHLWRFTDEDVWALAEVMWAHGLRVVDYWHCDGGASFQVGFR